MRNLPIVISESQIARLRGLLPADTSYGRDRQHLRELRAELERARASALVALDGSRFEVKMRDGTMLAASRQRSRLLRERGC